jgi:hypothetical protein
MKLMEVADAICQRDGRRQHCVERLVHQTISKFPFLTGLGCKSYTESKLCLLFGEYIRNSSNSTTFDEWKKPCKDRECLSMQWQTAAVTGTVPERSDSVALNMLQWGMSLYTFTSPLTHRVQERPWCGYCLANRCKTPLCVHITDSYPRGWRWGINCFCLNSLSVSSLLQSARHFAVTLLSNWTHNTLVFTELQ